MTQESLGCSTMKRNLPVEDPWQQNPSSCPSQSTVVTQPHLTDQMSGGPQRLEQA